MENSHETPNLNNNEDTFSPPDFTDAPKDSWVRRHGPLIVILTAAFAYFMTQYNALPVVMVVVGISILVFVHELGHFLVAKWCDVHVQTFSIGLGPAIPGCSFRWGETTYKLSVIPLGGYVKMVGEGADESDGNDDPRSFKNKSVGQRMAIISAGVTMNIIFGFGCFVYVYMTHGEKRLPAVIDTTEVGSVAWQNGIHSGDVVHQIASKRNPYWEDFLFQVMNSVKGEKLDLVLGPPGVPEQNLTHLKVEPQRKDQDAKPIIGVNHPQDLKLYPERFKKYSPLAVRNESAAAEAQPPFEFGDEIIGTSDPAEPNNLEKVLPLPPDPRTLENPEHLDYFEFQKRLRLFAGKLMVIQVRRQKSSQIENLKVPPEFHYSIPGLLMEMGEVVALRFDSPAEKAGVEVHDVIEQVVVTDDQNRTTRYTSGQSRKATSGTTREESLDPPRLPYQLSKWAAAKSSARKVHLVVRRGSSTQELTLDWDDRWKFNNEVPMSPRWSTSLPGLGIAYQINTRVAEVLHDSRAADLGFSPGDVVQAYRFKKLAKKPTDKEEFFPWIDLTLNEWAHVVHDTHDAEVKELIIRIDRESQEISLKLVADKEWPIADRGLFLMPEFRLVKAETARQAVTIGWGRTWDFITGIYGNLRSLATGRISFTDNMGGPITVAKAAYMMADEDFYQYILFLGIISINLAIVNFLPIPVLDGGHMVFLIYEKLCRRPASRQVRIATTYIGLALIISLMLFVIYLDIKKEFS